MSVDSIRISSADDGMVSDSLPIWLSEVSCTGEESNIALCGSRGWRSHDCSHDQDAAVVCSNNEFISSSNILRLVDGDSVSNGRVQVMFNGIWGRVCSSYWDIRDGDVVCKQLGYTGSRSVQVYTSLSSDHHLGHVWMDGAHCTGNEKNLSYCEFNGWGHAESGCHDAGVDCEVFSSLSLEGNYQIRLRDGPSEDEGRVEVFYSGVWGTVCDTRWTLTHGHVVCRQLGYTSAQAVYSGSWYGEGSGVVLMDVVECQGDELRLVDCVFRGWGVVNTHCTSHTRDVSVHCDGMCVYHCLTMYIYSTHVCR